MSSVLATPRPVPRLLRAAALPAFVLLAMAPMLLAAVWQSDHWYEGLREPGWMPNRQWFEAIWLLAYAGTGAAGWIAWCRASSGRIVLFEPYLLQGALHLTWVAVFFGLHAPMTAAIVSGVLCLVTAWTVHRFGTVTRGAALAMLPMLGWLSFLTVLSVLIALDL